MINAIDFVMHSMYIHLSNSPLSEKFVFVVALFFFCLFMYNVILIPFRIKKIEQTVVEISEDNKILIAAICCSCKRYNDKDNSKCANE